MSSDKPQFHLLHLETPVIYCCRWYPWVLGGGGERTSKGGKKSRKAQCPHWPSAELGHPYQLAIARCPLWGQALFMHSLGSSNNLQRKGSETLSDLPKSPQLVGERLLLNLNLSLCFTSKPKLIPNTSCLNPQALQAPVLSTMIPSLLPSPHLWRRIFLLKGPVCFAEEDMQAGRGS